MLNVHFANFMLITYCIFVIMDTVIEWASQSMHLYILREDADTSSLQNIFLFRQYMISKENTP
jgi:hypothetical protein